MQFRKNKLATVTLFRNIAAAVTVVLAMAVAAPAAFAPNVPTITPAALKKQIAARKGKVVVVNFWATWCIPCVQEFPDLVALQKKYKAKGLDLITVSFDETSDLKTRVQPFLAKNKLTTGTYINKTGSDFDEEYLNQLEPKADPNAAVGLPRTYVFDRSGKLVRIISGASKLSAFEKAVAPYLAKRK